MKRCPNCKRELKDQLVFCPFDGAPLKDKSAADEFVGLLLDDKYRLDEKVGEGGMGKTSVANMIVQSMKPEVIVEDDLEIRTIPAFYTSFRSSKSLDALTADMFTKQVC